MLEKEIRQQVRNRWGGDEVRITRVESPGTIRSIPDFTDKIIYC